MHQYLVRSANKVSGAKREESFLIIVPKVGALISNPAKGTLGS